jgi:hypothetical protein
MAASGLLQRCHGRTEMTSEGACSESRLIPNTIRPVELIAWISIGLPQTEKLDFAFDKEIRPTAKQLILINSIVVVFLKCT